MADDLFLDLLLKQSVTRLRDMRAQVDEKRRLLDFEAEYLDRALAAKGADPGNASGTVAVGEPRAQSSGSTTSTRRSKRADIEAVMRTDPEKVWLPWEVRDRLAEKGVETTKEALRVAMKRMVGHELERPADGAHGFKLGSPNGGASHTSPSAVATAEGEDREMSLMDGSRQGAG